MTSTNIGFEFSAPGIARWAALRLGVYLGAAAVTLVLFCAGAAFYSFVWPAPPERLHVPSLRQIWKDPAPGSSPSLDPDLAIKNFFSPNPTESIVISDLSREQIDTASIIYTNRHLVGHLIKGSLGRGGDLSISVNGASMSNDFGLRTPHEIVMLVSELRWYRVHYPDRIEIYAVATEEQVNAAMARAIR
jgi:hypothetical protein